MQQFAALFQELNQRNPAAEWVVKFQAHPTNGPIPREVRAIGPIGSFEWTPSWKATIRGSYAVFDRIDPQRHDVTSVTWSVTGSREKVTIDVARRYVLICTDSIVLVELVRQAVIGRGIEDLSIELLVH
jgi:hypothetical protein